MKWICRNLLAVASVNLTYHSKPLAADQKLRVAINNYRYTGGGAYSVYKGLPIVYRSTEEVRDLIIDYLAKTKEFPDATDDNWRIIPDEAREAIEKQALSMEQRRGKRRGKTERCVVSVNTETR